MPVFTVCFIYYCVFHQSPIDRRSKTRCTQRLRTISTLSTTPKKLDLSWNIVGIEDDASDDSDDEVIVGNSRQKISEKLDAINKLLSLAGHGPITRTLHVGWVDATENPKVLYIKDGRGREQCA